MKIVCLYGRANTGKTTTLKMLSETVVRLGLGNFEDWTENNCSIRLSNGKLVCITSAGDDGETKDDNISYVDFHKPDLWFTAMRTKGESTDLEDYFSFDPLYYRKNFITDFMLIPELERKVLEDDLNQCDMKALLVNFVFPLLK